MTKVICTCNRYGGPLYFECKGHSDYKDKDGFNLVCAECSTLCSMLVRYIDKRGYAPAVCEDGHVKIDVDTADGRMNEVFQAAMLEFSSLEEKFPEYIKVY